MKQLDIYQALWGMEDIPSKANPYSMETKLNIIEEAGFDGVLCYINDSNEDMLKESYRTFDLIKRTPLKLGVSCHGNNLNDMVDKIDFTKKIGGKFLNIMVKDYYIQGYQALALLKKTLEHGKSVGVKVLIETHRGTITQDLIRTTSYIKELKDMELTIDFSHYVLAGELDFLSVDAETHLNALLKRAGSLHVRVSNGEQIQLSYDRISPELLNHYLNWWKTAVKSGLKKLNQGENFPVVIELGPENYQEKILTDGQWVYDGDRWKDALKWKALFEEL